MRRGSTKPIDIEVNLDLTQARVYVTFDQGEETIIEKTNEDITITTNLITCYLTQADTLKFEHGKSVRGQIRYIMEDGTSDSSDIWSFPAEEILKDGEIVYEA